MRKTNICGRMLGESIDEPRAEAKLKQAFRKTSSRRNLYHTGTESDDVTVICSGWAFRFSQLPDGRRQILSILIPGDLISPISLFSDKLNFSVQALTEVRSCAFSRAELHSGLSLASSIFNSFVKSCIVDAERADLTVADLGRRSASERVSRFILQLMDRLDERGLVKGQSFVFPLRQQHVADAVGLTTVHVSRVIGKFREAGLVEITRDRLKVVNLSELRRIAEMKQ